MTSGHFSLFLSLLCVAGLCQARPSVEIIEIYGEVSMQIGKPLIVKCGVTDFVSGGVFTWRIGREIIPSFGEAEVDDDRLIDSVRFEPAKKYDGQSLVCQYWVGEDVYSEDIKANIYLLDLPTSPVLVADLVEGEAASLSLTAGLYPRPENILWTIKDLAGTVETLVPGGETGNYRASQLQVEPSREDHYRLSLNISHLDQQEMAKTHEVSITTRDTTRTVSFEFAIRKEGIQTMGIGFIIIIVCVVVVVILICICCFFYKRNKGDERARKDSVLYSPVTTNPPPKP